MCKPTLELFEMVLLLARFWSIIWVRHGLPIAWDRSVKDCGFGRGCLPPLISWSRTHMSTTDWCGSWSAHFRARRRERWWPNIAILLLLLLDMACLEYWEGGKKESILVIKCTQVLGNGVGSSPLHMYHIFYEPARTPLACSHKSLVCMCVYVSVKQTEAPILQNWLSTLLLQTVLRTAAPGPGTGIKKEKERDVYYDTRVICDSM